MEKSNQKWGKAGRLQFIEFRLYWEGRINRSDLVDHFQISVPQASLDIASYLETAPGNVEYDKQRKAYFATENFKPVLTEPNARDYLSQLEMLRAEDESPVSHRSFVGMSPSFDIAQTPERVVSAAVFQRVLKAIREKLDMEIEYQSMTRPQPTWRWISPHAVASDGFRWHIRAYCHDRNKFIDFVFGRILHIGPTRASQVDSATDAPWHTMVELKIGPNPTLDEAQRKVIELDYAMSDGTATLVLREALAPYIKKRLGLLSSITGGDAPQATQHLCLISERRREIQ